jgi:hypothetical protein
LKDLPALDHIFDPNKELSAGERAKLNLLHSQLPSFHMFFHTLNPSPKEWVCFQLIYNLGAGLEEMGRIAASHLPASTPVVLRRLVGGWVEVDVCVVTG